MPRHQWRTTKYDPALRSGSGAFTENTWSSVWDIGKSFDTGTLSTEEYLRVESAYAETATSFAVESGVFQVEISDFESQLASQAELTELGLPEIPGPPDPGSRIPAHRIGDLVRLNLRELAWFKVRAYDFFIHFGHDFYMYIGSDTPCEDSRRLAESLGIFVEYFESPHL